MKVSKQNKKKRPNEWTQFIEMVHDRPCLWNPGDSDFRDVAWTKNRWQEIEQECGLDAGMALKKWKNLKDTYRRQLQKDLSSKSKGTSSSKWIHYNELSFLKTVMGPRVKKKFSRTLVKDEEMETEDESQSEPEFETKTLTRTKHDNSKQNADPLGLAPENKKQTENVEKNTQDEDADYHFLMSFKKYMKNMDEEQQLKFRIKMQELVYDVMYGGNQKNKPMEFA